MYLEIISPETTLFSGEVKSLTLPGSVGRFQLLENHAPIVSTLQAGVVKIKSSVTLNDAAKALFETVGKDEFIYTISAGTVEMRDNKIILLSD
jgi:F-type H+-transporting ATPase subunit epsilon